MRVSPVVDLLDAGTAESVGAKAARLGDLLRAGFAVPAGFVLSVALDDADLSSAVDEALPRLRGDRFAVRSSALAEDSATASFAGQYETRLEVPREGVAGAVQACRASGQAGRVAAYRDGRRLSSAPSGVGVIVQEMIDPAAAGVAFSADPLTGDRGRTLISAVRGLGERLVSGQATADEWAVEAGQASCRSRPEEAIDAAGVLRVAALARAAANHFGCPQDIEWALDRQGRLFLLQARPITALPDQVRWESPDGGSYRRDIRLGEWFYEPLTPLFDDWLVRRLEASERDLIYRMSRVFPIRERYHVLVNGWYFLDIGFVPHSPLGMAGLMLRLARFGVPRAIRHPSLLPALLPPNSALAARAQGKEFRKRILPGHRRLVEECRQRVEVAEAGDLVAIVDRLADAAGVYFVYIAIVAGYAWKSEAKLAQFCRKHLAGSGMASHQELVLGCYEPPSPPAHRVMSLDWFRPLPAETGQLEPDDQAASRQEGLLARRRAAEAAARSVLAGRPRLRRRFEALLAEAQEFVPIREEIVAEFTLGWPVLRRALRRLAEHLVKRGLMTDPDEIFFLTREEVIAEANDLAAVARARRGTWERQRHLTPPLRLGPDVWGFRKMVDDHIDNFRAPARAEGEQLLRGVPCSPGVARGRVRVISGLETFDDFQSGEVLVAQATTPGWTPLFSRAVAVVTDTGSVTAHASLVAREYGIPAVAGTGDGTRRLRDGMLVTVDGSAGVVLEGR